MMMPVMKKQEYGQGSQAGPLARLQRENGDGRHQGRGPADGVRLTLQCPTADRPDQSSAMVYFSRTALAWRVSITIGTTFCLLVVEEALACSGPLVIVHTEYGYQSTSGPFSRLLKVNEVSIRMDGKGSGRDDVFVEGQCKRVKSEEVYQALPEARK
jgi:hypothetical protein